jgi:hypothetical protein
MVPRQGFKQNVILCMADLLLCVFDLVLVSASTVFVPLDNTSRCATLASSYKRLYCEKKFNYNVVPLIVETYLSQLLHARCCCLEEQHQQSHVCCLVFVRGFKYHATRAISVLHPKLTRTGVAVIERTSAWAGIFEVRFQQLP